MGRTFRSDNNAGLCPEAMQALFEANDRSHVVGYGDDQSTADAVKTFEAVFGEDIAVYLVATGSAANTLAIAALTEPWQRVICHRHSHFNDDESTAPERIAHCRVSAIDTDEPKLSIEQMARMASESRGDVHQPQAGVVTISNSTEFGAVYSPEDVRAIAEAAHARGYRVHMDGARFANAVASCDCDPRDLTNRAGVDALSFGGTKNGLAFGEAVIFFPQGDRTAFEHATRTFEFHRKGTGHLLSKHRFFAAPFAALMKDGVWLRNARHANVMAAALARGLGERGFRIRFPVQANAVFVEMTDAQHEAITRAGYPCYRFGDPAWNLVRLMCSFDTAKEDVEGLLAALGRA